MLPPFRPNGVIHEVATILPQGLELNRLYNCQNNHFIIMGLTFCCGAINNRLIQVKITAVQLHCEMD